LESEKRGKSNLQEKDWVYFLTNLGVFGHFEDWFLLGGFRIELGFPEA
jgi:hypothetical protein